MCFPNIVPKSHQLLYDPVLVASKAVSPSDTNCFGYQNTDTGGHYITTLKLSTGVINIEGLDNDKVLTDIVSYDKAEKNSAYMGQVNVITVSSFTGPLSAIWGYDLAKANKLYDKLLFKVPDDLMHIPQGFQPHSLTKSQIPVYSIDPLLEATQALFGTADSRHFPIIAGAHVACAMKKATSIDPITNTPVPGWIWCFLALAIAERRECDASLFIEDVGFFPDEVGVALFENEVIKKLKEKQKQVVLSQYLCGINQNTPFSEIFVGYRYERVDTGYFGCALSCAPYITLAKEVYPINGGTKRLAAMSLEEWTHEKQISY